VTPPGKRTVLIVEDESLVARDIQQTLDGFGYDAFAVASSAEEALARAAEKRPDIVLMDIGIKGQTDGVMAARLLQQRYGVPVIYVTAHADEATLEAAKETRPQAYLHKPVKPAELRTAIEIGLHNHDMDAYARGATAPPLPGPDAPRPAPRSTRAPGARMVRRQVEHVLASGDFDAPERSKQFLRYIVNEALAGRGDAITQGAIATEVFGRREGFDPMVDPIVRIQAGRLRRSLERYYLLSGKQDAVRIELPTGGYLPIFSHAPAAEEKTSGPLPEAAPRHPGDDWPSVVVGAFDLAGPGSAPEEVGLLHEVLALELARYHDVRVVLARELDPPDPSRSGARFALSGRVRSDDDGWRVSAHLVDKTTGEQIWGDSYHTSPKPGRWSGTLEDIARVIAARVGAEEGILVQSLAVTFRSRGLVEPTAYGAVLRSFEFFLARDPHVLTLAIESLRQVVARQPECALAWTRLARLHIANYAFEVTADPAPIDQAVACAQNGVRVDPTSRSARCILASALLVKGELTAAREELEQALRLSPDSLVYLEIIGYLLTLLGDWERGRALSLSALERNPHCLPHVGFGLWTESLRRGELEAAYRAALEYRDATFFWRPVMRASCLGLLGRESEAGVEVAELLRRKPDFETRGRVLIGHYIKFPEVMRPIVDGLAKAGLNLASGPVSLH